MESAVRVWLLLRPFPGSISAVGITAGLSYLPSDFHTLTVHLTVDGAAEYIEFLKRSFDAVVVVLSAGEGPHVLCTAILAALRAVRRPSLNLLGHSRLARLDVVVHTEEVRRIVLIL